MHQSLVFCLASLVLPCVATASTLSSDAPFCALRFGYRYTQPDKWPEMRAALKKNLGAFDEVWFSTGINFYARCDRASGGRLPVLFEGSVMAFALPRVRDDGTLVTLALVNASIDRQEPVTVRLRGVPADMKTAVWHQPETADAELAMERRDGEAIVRLPRIGAWECGYLIFK